MRKMGFRQIWSNWIKVCISSPFSILINGSLHSFFRGNRGFRQGDPLLPHLPLWVESPGEKKGSVRRLRSGY